MKTQKYFWKRPSKITPWPYMSHFCFTNETNCYHQHFCIFGLFLGVWHSTFVTSEHCYFCNHVSSTKDSGMTCILSWWLLIGYSTSEMFLWKVFLTSLYGVTVLYCLNILKLTSEITFELLRCWKKKKNKGLSNKNQK